MDTYELTHALLEACLVKGYDKKTVVFSGVDAATLVRTPLMRTGVS